jgi:hypothetical protein
MPTEIALNLFIDGHLAVSLTAVHSYEVLCQYRASLRFHFVSLMTILLLHLCLKEDRRYPHREVMYGSWTIIKIDRHLPCRVR